MKRYFTPLTQTFAPAFSAGASLRRATGFLILVALIAGLQQSVTAATTILAFQPTSVTLAPDDSTELALNVVNGGNVYGADIQIQYDSAIVSISGMDTGSCPEPGFVVENSVQGLPLGLARYVVTQLNPQAPCDSGRVATVSVTCLAEGSSTLDLSNSLLSSADGEVLAHTQNNGMVVCDANAASNPSSGPGSNSAELSLSPSNALDFNGLATVDVRLDYASDVYGADLSLAFDASKLRVVDADPTADGVQIAAGSCPARGLMILNEADNAAGTIRYALTQVNPQPACDGGAAARIQFACLTVADSDVTIASGLISNAAGEAVANTTIHGSVSCARVAPAPTPMPTATTPSMMTPEPTPEPIALRLISMLPRQGVNNLPNEAYVYGDGLSNNDQVYLGDTLLESNYIETILSAYHTVIVPKGLAPGSYTLRVVRQDLTEESLTDAYTVIAGETIDDLSGLATELWINPAAPSAGLDADIGLRVQRRGGDVAVGNVQVAFYDGDPNGSGTLIGTATIASIEADSSAETPPVQWIPATEGTRDLYAVIDASGVLSESDEDNNIVQRSVTILPPPPEGNLPTVTAFTIDDGAMFTTDRDVQLKAAATDPSSPIESLLYIEFTYNQNAGTWLPVQNSGWLPYGSSRDMNWTLSPHAGAKFMQAWAVDVFGNVSAAPLEATINLVLASDHLAEGQVRVYRQYVEAGDTIAVDVESLVGDADLYIWPPSWPSDPVQFSISTTGVDVVSFVAPVTGMYQVEAFGFSSADYIINFNTSRRATNTGRSVLNKEVQSEPVTTEEENPTEQQALPTPSRAEVPTTSIGAIIRDAASSGVLLWAAGLVMLTILVAIRMRRTARD